MNDIVKNTELFVNILGMSRTSAVQKWDHEAFQRAFRWAQYFEQVHKKTKSKPQIVERIVKHLSEVCSQVNVRLGISPLSYNDLSASTCILRNNLLQNPHLSNDFYLQLVGQFNKEANGKENLKSQIHSLSKLKATVQILRLVENRFQLAAKEGLVTEISKSTSQEVNVNNNKYADGQASAISVTKGQITANAILLRKSLLSIFLQGALPDCKKEELHKKLKHMIEHDKGVDVVLLALVYDEDKNEHIVDYLISFVQDVLLPQWKTHWKSFLQISLSQLLAKCSSMYKSFSDVYFELLKHCGDKLQEEIEKNDYALLMEKSNSAPHEQMCTYYYFLLQNLLQALSQTSSSLEMKLEAFIREQCRRSAPPCTAAEVMDTNVWVKLSHDMMVSSAI